jgi:hypothetical protein
MLSWKAVGTALLLLAPSASLAKTCTLSPLGAGQDDTGQVCSCTWESATLYQGANRLQILAAVDACGVNGRVVLGSGQYNITR